MKRVQQIVLIGTFLCFSWLAMQAVHELGHVLLAWFTGAEVVKVVLHPLTISRTDLGHNPHPLAVVWGGPILGSLLPLLAFGLVSFFRLPGVYLFRFFAGFCLVANGVYIGTGWLLANGADPWIMTENGSPVWLLGLFGLVSFPFGLFLWHRQGPYFGLGEARGNVSGVAAIVSVTLLIVFVGTELMRNVR